QLADYQAEMKAEGKSAVDGQVLFNVNCARCHTKGWSIGEPEVAGAGAYGPNLTNGAEVRQFPDRDSHVEFVDKGAEFGKPYGVRGIGNLAAAALSGWFVIMGVVWAVFGIGVPGRTPGWKVSEIISGDVAKSTTLKNFPDSFERLPPGDPDLADAQSSADKFLASSAATPKTG